MAPLWCPSYDYSTLTQATWQRHSTACIDEAISRARDPAAACSLAMRGAEVHRQSFGGAHDRAEGPGVVWPGEHPDTQDPPPWTTKPNVLAGQFEALSHGTGQAAVRQCVHCSYHRECCAPQPKSPYRTQYQHWQISKTRAREEIRCCSWTCPDRWLELVAERRRPQRSNRASDSAV